VFPLGLL
jgi:hypothetical protein